jgi:hypothetical protein
MQCLTLQKKSMALSGSSNFFFSLIFVGIEHKVEIAALSDHLVVCSCGEFCHLFHLACHMYLMFLLH